MTQTVHIGEGNIAYIFGNYTSSNFLCKDISYIIDWRELDGNGIQDTDADLPSYHLIAEEDGFIYVEPPLGNEIIASYKFVIRAKEHGGKILHT